MIRLTHVSKHFGGRKDVVGLDDISLEVARGELVSIVGPSGSGKSTLLNLIGGLDQPTSGEIEIDGQSIAQLSDDALTGLRREKIGFIFQFFNLMPSLTCLENVALPLHLRGWPARKAGERARELLDLVQLNHRIEHLPDEPTGNLDSRSGAEILDLIRSLHRRLNATILIVTHDAGVARSCSRTIALQDARIVADYRNGSEAG